MNIELKDTLNQRWKNDKTGFGFKMLQKMGWKEDKGLGKNETGIVASVKVTKREDGLGLGMDKQTDSAGNNSWSETATSFNSVLDLLKSTYNNNKKEKKPKKSVKTISVGMKYKRIREAKDLSTKSSSEKIAIFGSAATNIYNINYNINEDNMDNNNTNTVVEEEKEVKKDKKKKRKKDKSE